MACIRFIPYSQYQTHINLAPKKSSPGKGGKKKIIPVTNMRLQLRAIRALRRWNRLLRYTFSLAQEGALQAVWSCTTQQERSTHTLLFLQPISPSHHVINRNSPNRNNKIKCEQTKLNWRWWRGSVFLHDSNISHRFLTPILKTQHEQDLWSKSNFCSRRGKQNYTSLKFWEKMQKKKKKMVPKETQKQAFKYLNFRFLDIFLNLFCHIK